MGSNSIINMWVIIKMTHNPATHKNVIETELIQNKSNIG